MKAPRFLIIRRDNIGDLVCTTPLIAAIRQKHPHAWIGVVANSYNAPVLEGNSDIDAIYAYRKAKHGETSALGAAWERVRMVASLRRRALDYAIVATPADRDRGLRIARFVGAKHVIAFVRPGARAPGVDTRVPLSDHETEHEVELVWRAGRALGLEGAAPPLKVVAADEVVTRVRSAIEECRWTATGPLVALHVSARKPSQRWPAEQFAMLIRRLHEARDARFILLWAPGAKANAMHPGDDEKAEQVIAATRDVPVQPWPTLQLRELIGALAACDVAVLADGGASHIAAALGKPLVVFFGQSDPRRWRPWGVQSEILQPVSRNVADITVDEALSAFQRLV